MIFTFYSYKGGVGRSMALANIAELLYQRGLRVILVDWDLEAPGLEKFFLNDETEIMQVQSRVGLMDMLLAYRRRFTRELAQLTHQADTETTIDILEKRLDPISDVFLYPIRPRKPADDSSSPALWLLPAGRSYGTHFSTYAQEVQRFDWSEFYNDYQGEAYFEWLRRQLLNSDLADVVLIDSRTGVTEMGGVCTRQLADVVIMLVAPNNQNLNGTAMMAQSLTSTELKLARNDRELSLIVVPSRVELKSENDLLEKFREQFVDRFAPYFPKEIRFNRSTFNEIRIPYIPYYAYMEMLVVTEEERHGATAGELVKIYENLTEMMAQLAPSRHPLHLGYHELPGVPLKDIVITARQESHLMRHYYLGVEHLMVALLQIQGGLTSLLMEDYGLSPTYVIDRLRHTIGKGNKLRLWAGTPTTPRAERVLNRAEDIALDNGRSAAQERDILIALLEETRSIAVQVLIAVGVDINAMSADAVKRVYGQPNNASRFIRIDLPDKDVVLSNDELLILRRMFASYMRVRVEAEFEGGFSAARLFLVTPFQADGRADAATVVKIGPQDSILDEAYRYETHVKNTLPPLTARLEDRPVAPEISSLAGLKYSLVATADQTPQNLLQALRHGFSPEKLSAWLTDGLYGVYSDLWWSQSRPYRFQLWREYDWMLPPLFNMELIKESEQMDVPRTLRMPLRSGNIQDFEPGDVINVENMVIHEIKPDTNQLTLKANTELQPSLRIAVQGFDLSAETYYRGEIIQRFQGRILETRKQQLIHAIRDLDPDFDPTKPTIDILSTPHLSLPNPAFAYEDLMQMQISGMLSAIHGDLRLGNILLGPNDSPTLIDFAHTRDGHTVFDWATLETSLWVDWIVPQVDENWLSIYGMLEIAAAIQANTPLPDVHTDLHVLLEPIRTARKIAALCSANEKDPTEYLVTLSLCNLRSIRLRNLSLGSRRFALLLAALCIHELSKLFSNQSTDEDVTMATPMPDDDTNWSIVNGPEE